MLAATAMIAGCFILVKPKQVKRLSRHSETQGPLWQDFIDDEKYDELKLEQYFKNVKFKHTDGF